MNLKPYFLIAVFFVYSFTNAQIPSYYQNVDFTLTGQDLRDNLEILISTTHATNLSYTPGVWNVLKQSDLNPDVSNSTDVVLLYGYNDTDAISKNDRLRSKDLSCHSSSCQGKWNREHIFSKSLGTPNLGTQFAGSDAHNLRATDSQFNTTRSNRAYAEGNGNATVTSNGYFFPGDEYKGDVARVIMYMYVRYRNQCQALDVGNSNSTYAPYADMPDVFLEWNQQDPPSQIEFNRNNQIQLAQGNRNPFIDNPYLATLIWNGPKANDTWNLLSIDTTELDAIRVYPTVTNNKITIDSSVIYAYEIYNYVGQQVVKRQYSTNNQVSLAHLKNGVYIMKIYTDKGFKTFKILKK